MSKDYFGGRNSFFGGMSLISGLANLASHRKVAPASRKITNIKGYMPSGNTNLTRTVTRHRKKRKSSRRISGKKKYLKKVKRLIAAPEWSPWMKNLRHSLIYQSSAVNKVFYGGPIGICHTTAMIENMMNGTDNLSFATVDTISPAVEPTVNRKDLFDSTRVSRFNKTVRIRSDIDMRFKNLEPSGCQIDIYLMQCKFFTHITPDAALFANYHTGLQHNTPSITSDFFYEVPMTTPKECPWNVYKQTSIMLNAGEEAYKSYHLPSTEYNLDSIYDQGHQSFTYQKGMFCLIIRQKGELTCAATAGGWDAADPNNIPPAPNAIVATIRGPVRDYSNLGYTPSTFVCHYQRRDYAQYLQCDDAQGHFAAPQHTGVGTISTYAVAEADSANIGTK